MTSCSNRKRAALLLLIYAAGCLALVVAARLLLKNGVHPNCLIYATTGFYCPSCGATRAVDSLLKLNLWQSFAQNPAPLLIALFMALLMIHELRNLFGDARRPVKWILPYVYAFAAALLISCTLRNVGVLPPL